MTATITTAFATLRRDGFIARSSFTCCQGCAWSEIEKLNNKRHAAVFFTRQDARTLRTHGRVYVAFGSTKANATDAERAEIGARAKAALEGAGCVVVWSGDADERLLVYRDAETYRTHALKRLGGEVESPATRRRR